jgi:DNA primase
MARHVDEAAVVAQLHGLADQVAGQLRTGRDWQTALDHAARLPGTSFTNGALLIPAQMGAVRATRVADAATWRAWGRQIRDGQRGLAVLVHLPGAQVGAARLFDISHTTGPALPPAARTVADPGRSPAGLWDALVRQAAAAGHLVVRYPAGPGPAGTIDRDGTIHIRLGLSTLDATTALAHELGHVLLRHDLPDGRCTGTSAVEADSVAYLVSAWAGLDVPGWRFPPVGDWAGDVAGVRAAGTRVVAAAGTITARIAAEQAAPVDRDRARRTAAAARDGARHAAAVAAKASAAGHTDRPPVVVSEAGPAAQRLLAAVDAATTFYTTALRRDRAAMAYLRSRDLEWALRPGSPWVIGYAPPQWTALTRRLRDLGFTTQEAVDAGLVATGTQGPRDWCADRLLFGIRDHRLPGVPVVGFTGRTLQQRDPKYLNTPTTTLYRPDELLFGLAEQRLALPAAGWTPVIVKGPTDALAVARMGHQYAGMGLCGTALSAAHAHTLADTPGRGNRILVALDGDDGSRGRAEPVFDALAAALDRRDPGCRVYAVPLPVGADPDSLGPRALWQALHAELPHLDQVVVDQRIHTAMRGRGDVVAQVAAARAAARFIATRPDPAHIERLNTHVTRRLGLDVGIMPDLVLDQLRGQATAPQTVRTWAQRNVQPRTGDRGQRPAITTRRPATPAPTQNWGGQAEFG